MIILQTRSGETVRMRNGEPFTYSTRALADGGRRILSGVRGESLRIVELQAAPGSAAKTARVKAAR